MNNSLTSRITSFLNNKHFMSLTGNLTVQVINIIYFGLLFRYMQVEELGAYVFFNSVLGLADSLRTGFITTAFVRWYSGATATRAAEVMGSTWVIAIVLTLGFGALNLGAYLVSSHMDNEGLNLFLRWSGLSLLLMLPLFMAICVLQAEQRFDKLLYVRGMQLGLSVLGLFVLLLLQKVNVTNVIYTNLVAAGITSLVALVAGWTRIGDIRYRSLECAKELAHFGKYSMGSQIGATLLRNSDTFIINFMLSPAALAVYNLAQRFMIVIELLVGSSIATVMPSLSVAFNKSNKEELVKILTRNVGVLTWIFVPIALGTVLLAEIPIYILGGSKYMGTEAANLLRMFMAMSVLFPLDRFTGVALEVINKPRLNLIKVFIMLVVNIAGDIIGIHFLHSIYGVAIASFPMVLSGFIFGFLVLKKDIPLSLTEILRVGLVEIKSLIAKLLGVFKPAPEI